MTVAIVLLVLCLIFIGVSLYNSKYNTQFPPVVADCPDYWLDMSEGDGSRCVNRMDLGSSSSSKEMDFSGSFWTGDDCMIEVEGKRFLAILFLRLMKVLTEHLQVIFSVKMRQIFPN